MFGKLINLFKKEKEKEKKFNVEILSNLNLGDLDGETDQKLQEETFIKTYSNLKTLNNNKYNYVIGDYGSGKSALFMAIKKKFIAGEKNEADFFKHKNIIGLNKSFCFEKDFLNQVEITKKSLVTIWALYLLKQFIKNILEEHSSKSNFDEFQKYISEYEILKNEFDLKNILDYIKINNIVPTFTFNGIPMKLELTTKAKIQRSIDINKIFDKISKFYSENKLETWLIIDKLDDFIRYEDSKDRLCYIQSLHETIEELRNLENIRPILFIRKDLFEDVAPSIGAMKVRDRIIELQWTDLEFCNFIFSRFLKNNDFLVFFKTDFQNVLSKHNNKCKKTFFNWTKSCYKFNGKTQADLTVIKELLYLFLPPKHNGKDFIEYLKEELFVETHINPRIALKFFNTLFDKQNLFFSENSLINQNYGEKKNHNYNIFTKECINSAIKSVKKEALLNVKSSFLEEDLGIIFIGLHQRILNDTNLKYYNLESILTNLGLEAQEVNYFVKRLESLNYLKLGQGKKYYIPKLFKIKLQ